MRELREEFDCPIIYDHYRQSYVYEERGQIIVGFEHLSENYESRVIGGKFKKDETLYLFVQ